MSDDERATPCWYTKGVWHDNDGKPVKNNDDKNEYIDSIISLRYENSLYLKTFLDNHVL